MPTLTLKKNRAVVNEGICKCIYEPRGDGGLEGFNIDALYRFQVVEKAGRYVRIFHATALHKTESAAVPPIEIGMYYETVGIRGPNSFTKFFQTQSIKNVSEN